MPGLAQIAYCGAPPSPQTLLERWNLDPLLIAALVALASIYAVGAARSGVSPWRRASFAIGWASTSLFLLSPLCALSVSLFSARVGQHMLLTSIAAPLVALGQPVQALASLYARKPAAPHPPRRREPLIAAGLFAVALWYWHAPEPYALTFSSTVVYWLMHLTLYGSALWLWSALLTASGERLAEGIAAGLLTTAQMSLLGATITFADRPLYGPHLFTAPLWGLSPLEDQQLGGVLMWIPAGFILVGVLAIGFLATLRRAEARATQQMA